MKHFDQELRRLHKIHWHTYPKAPRMNDHAEHSNQTIQEEFLLYHEELMLDSEEFNHSLIPWLLWFNADRLQWSLNLKSPVQFLTEKYLRECKMW
jgi:transposase InsO family protein